MRVSASKIQQLLLNLLINAYKYTPADKRIAVELTGRSGHSSNPALGNSALEGMHTVLGEVLQETFVIAPGVGGEVTFATSKPVTREQLLPILELLLRGGAARVIAWDPDRALDPVRRRRAGARLELLPAAPPDPERPDAWPVSHSTAPCCPPGGLE